jgi:cytoskeletal protein RodZ
MKKGLEELKNLDYELVVSKAHIMQSTLEHILNKRFDKLNPVKAKGFIKILEREFDLDLSDWMQEFDAYYSVKEPEIATIDKLNAEVVKNAKKTSPKLALSLFGVAAILGLGYFVYLQQNSVSPDANGSASLQNEINESNASMAFNISFDANKTDVNATKDANATEQNKTEINNTKQTAAALVAPGAAQKIFYVEPTKKVWIGIRYLDVNKSRWFETVSEHKFDFNSSREQLIAFGHSQVKFVLGDNVINSRAGGKVRYYYKNGKLKEIGEEEYDKISGKTETKKDTNSTKSKQ